MIGNLIQPEFEEMIQRQAWGEIRDAMMALQPADAADLLIDLPHETEGVVFRVLPKERAALVFSYLPLESQEELVQALSSEQTRGLIEQMTPDDRARLFEELPPDVTRRLLDALSPEELKATRDLLGYPPETAGRFMTPEYIALRPDMTAAQALQHVRLSGRGKETLATMYVVEESGRLLHDVFLSALVLADPETKVADIKDAGQLRIPVSATTDEVIAAFDRYDRNSLPVVDADGDLLGIITIDDVLDAAQRAATEEIQMIGGTEALETPYLETGLGSMLRKRGRWLSVLFLGQMLTATAIAGFEGEIQKAIVLTLFLPLIISSGGNCGSQSATLIIRALAVGDVTVSQWLTVLRRELVSGATLGAWLGLIGFGRVALWHMMGWADYTQHWALVGLAVSMALVGVVLLGSLAGSMLPLLLRRIGLDPATSSAPFVATICDVTGVVIYFGIAVLVLKGTVL